jgi:hypothetical protein
MIKAGGSRRFSRPAFDVELCQPILQKEAHITW